MDLIDEKLATIFKESNVTDFIEAYAYLISCGCYKQFEAISNALFHFNVDDVNKYDLIIFRQYSDKTNVEFYKRPTSPHLDEFITHFLNMDFSDNMPYAHRNFSDIIFEKPIIIEVSDESLIGIEISYIMTKYKGKKEEQYVESNSYRIIGGIINPDDDEVGEMIADDMDDEINEDIIIDAETGEINIDGWGVGEADRFVEQRRIDGERYERDRIERDNRQLIDEWQRRLHEYGVTDRIRRRRGEY